MRLIRFGGAISLDGSIAGPNGEYDWIVHDPDFDFAAMWKPFDTFLIGRRTWDAMRKMGNARPTRGIQYVVFSRTLRPQDCPGAILSDDAVAYVKELRARPGKDIAVFEELNQTVAAQMQPYQETVTRLVEIPGIGAEAAQEILAEIGPDAQAFPSPGQLASWIGVCPGSDESAGENHSGRCAKGNRFLRRLLSQAAQAAARTRGSHLESVFKRMVVRLGYVKAIWAIAHRICIVVWKILHTGDRFIEFSQSPNPRAIQRAINHRLKALRRLGYRIPQLAVAASA